MPGSLKGCQPTIGDPDSSPPPLSFSQKETDFEKKKYDTPVIELSRHQPLESHLGTSVLVPPTQS